MGKYLWVAYIPNNGPIFFDSKEEAEKYMRDTLISEKNIDEVNILDSWIGKKIENVKLKKFSQKERITDGWYKLKNSDYHINILDIEEIENKQDYKSYLKPCPFCGASVEHLMLNIDDSKCSFYISCDECGAHGSLCSDEDDAIEIWNSITRKLDSIPDITHMVTEKDNINTNRKSLIYLYNLICKLPFSFKTNITGFVIDEKNKEISFDTIKTDSQEAEDYLIDKLLDNYCSNKKV